MATNQSLLSIVLRVKAKGFDAALMRAGKSLKKFGTQASATGRRLTTSLTAPILAIAAVAGKAAVDFEFAMAKVAAVGGFTSDELGRLEAQAKQLGASTAKSASEVAGLQLELAKLGKTEGEIRNMTEGVVSLGIAFDEELGTVAAEVGATLNRFNLDSSKTNGVVDVMAKAFGSSALDLDKFSSAMAKAGPTANALGISLEDTTAAIGILTNNGIEASTAGTALTKAMTTLAKKGVEPSQILATLFNGGLDVATAFELFGDRAGKVIPVLQQNGEEWKSLANDLYNADGAAATARATLENTSQGALQQMKSALEGAALSLSDILLPLITKLANFVTELANRFAALNGETKKQIAKFLGIAAAVGPALMLIGKFSTAIGTLLQILPMLTGPVGIIVAIVAAAIVAIIRNWDAVVAYFRDGPGATFLDTVISYVETIINGIITVFGAGVDMVMAFWDAWGETIMETLINVAENMQKALGFLFETLGSLFNAFKNLFEGNWQGFLANLANVLISSLQFLLTAFLQFFILTASLIDGVAEKLGFDTGIAEGIEKGRDGVIGWLEDLKFEVEEVEKSVFSLGDAFSSLSGFSLGGGGRGSSTGSVDSGVDGGTGVAGDDGGTYDPENLALYNDLLSETATLGEQVGESIGASTKALADGFADAIVEGESLGDALKNVFKNLLKQILSLAISYAIAAALSPLAPDNMVSGGASGAAKAAAAPGLVAALFGAIPKFAMGGAVTGPTLAMIGERPGSRGEFVVPFERMGQFMDMAGANNNNQMVSGRISSGDIFLSNETSDRLVSRRRVVA